MGIVNSIKKDAIKSGANKDKVLYVKAGAKVRVRFLQELDSGSSFVFHSSFSSGINCICGAVLGKSCIYCNNEDIDDLKTRTMYAWSVYNYDTKRVEIALFAVNRCSPAESFVTLSETFGTIMDRDFVLVKRGQGFESRYDVIPQDKGKFRNEKAKPFTESSMIKILAKAFPYDGADEDEDEEEEEEKLAKKGKKPEKSKKAKKPAAAEDDDLEEEDFDEEEEEEEEEPFGVSDMEDMLEDEDIDVDDFLEYVEAKSLKKLAKNNDLDEKDFRKLIKKYLKYIDE